MITDFLKKITTIAFLISLFAGCSPITKSIYGIENPKALSKEKIDHRAKHFGILVADNFILDSTYFTFLNKQETTTNKNEVKNHKQPLQALYFTSNGSVKSFHINCNASGFPNLDWNRNGIMDTFPPGQQEPVDSLVTLHVLLKFAKVPSQHIHAYYEHFDYIVVVVWTNFMGRQTKRFIKTIQQNSKLNSSLRVKLIYLNADNLFLQDNFHISEL